MPHPNRKRSSRKERGFSILELSIVCGIISCLAAIAIPSFRVSVYQAHDTERAQTFGTIERMMRDYYNNHYQYPANSAVWNPVQPVGTVQPFQTTPPLVGWSDIGLAGDGQGYTYRYSFTTTNVGCTYGLYCQATITAKADLDGDGQDSLWSTNLWNGEVLPNPAADGLGNDTSWNGLW